MLWYSYGKTCRGCHSKNVCWIFQLFKIASAKTISKLFSTYLELGLKIKQISGHYSRCEIKYEEANAVLFDIKEMESTHLTLYGLFVCLFV